MTKLEQVAFATDAFAANGRTHTDIKITPDTKIDQVITPLQETFQQRLGNGMVGEFFLIASKWNLYKTVYSFLPGFLDALSDTEDTQFHLESLRSLPVPCFFISDPGRDRIGMFVYIELTDTEAFFHVTDVHNVVGENINMAMDSLWIQDKQSIHEALTDWMSKINEGKDFTPYYERAYKNLTLAIQTAYYLSASNAVKAEVKTPKGKRPKRKNGTPLNLRKWDVGYRIGSVYPGEQAGETTDDRAGMAAGETGASPRPHLRRAHWHHYWAGEGRSKLILKWLAPIWVNGGEEDIVAAEHVVS